MNATTGVAWLSFFVALRTIEPALVQVLFYGAVVLGGLSGLGVHTVALVSQSD